MNNSRSMLRIIIASIVVIFAACGGGGGGDSAPTPSTTPLPMDANFTLSGTLNIAPTAAVDSDSNDASQASQGNYRANDTVATAQTLTTPVLLVGTVNEARKGPDGNNYAPGDVDDFFKVDLVAGQVVELEFAADPQQSDVDLYVVAEDGLSIGSSSGPLNRYECVLVTASKRYYINVNAYSNASIYNLRVGAPGSAGTCRNSTGLASASAGQLLAKAKPIQREAAQRLNEHIRIAGVRGAELAIVESGADLVPHLLYLPEAAGARAQGLAVLGNRPTAKAAAKDSETNTLSSTGFDHPIELLKYAKRLQASGGFEYVQPNWIAEPLAIVGEFPPSDRSYSLQRWHYEQINLPAAMTRITQLASQPTQRPIVAVIDDGIVIDHPDLAPQLFSSGRSFITRNTAGDGNSASADNPSRPSDKPRFHGTHVAGTVGAATYNGIGGAGTAPMAFILPLRVLDPKTGAKQVDTISAILYASRLPNNSGLLPARRADVINLSLGSARPCDSAFQDAITQAREAGVIVVAAAGNDANNGSGQRAPVGSPANCRGVIAVSALDARKQLANYSNTGVEIAVAAPGGDEGQSTTGTGSPDGIYSDIATFDATGVRQPSFGSLQGTSMASPHVAGVMALMRYVNPAITVAQVDGLMAQGALTDDIGTVGNDVDFGYGLINARKAVNAALATGSNPSAAPAGRVVGLPSSFDFGTFQTTATLELVATATTPERVISITSNSAAVTVSAASVDNITKLGKYTLTVNRSALGIGSIFPILTVTVTPSRVFTVQLAVSKTATGGNTSGADFGPLYVLLIDPDTQTVVKTVLATRANGKYSWTASGYTNSKVSVIAGSDLDNNDLICERGEPCGAFPVLSPGGDLAVLNLTGNRGGIDFEVTPFSGISAASVDSQAQVAWRKSRTPASEVIGSIESNLQLARPISRPKQ